jgi:hypothetical protein
VVVRLDLSTAVILISNLLSYEFTGVLKRMNVFEMSNPSRSVFTTLRSVGGADPGHWTLIRSFFVFDSEMPNSQKYTIEFATKPLRYRMTTNSQLLMRKLLLIKFEVGINCNFNLN